MSEFERKLIELRNCLVIVAFDEILDAHNAHVQVLEGERSAVRRLLREVDDYLGCVEDRSMSRNNAESLASELRASIAIEMTAQDAFAKRDAK